MKEKTYGFFATVYAKSNLEMKDFTKYFSEKTFVQNIWCENSEEEPFELITYAETLGFLLCIEESSINEAPAYKYKISICTSDMAMETAYDRRHELSNWFAKYVCTVCDLPTVIKEEEKYLKFSFDSKTGKINEEYLN